jgi:hypothetical protein
MTTPDELQRAVERLKKAVVFAEGASLVDHEDIDLLLSERAELLAAVERMRGALEKIASGLPETRAVHRLSEARAIARAALTTGEEK